MFLVCFSSVGTAYALYECGHEKMITIILVGGDTMPWGDRTGPSGMGPMTGRAAGYCAGYAMPGYATMMHGWGGGFGRRGGWGRRNRF